MKNLILLIGLFLVGASSVNAALIEVDAKVNSSSGGTGFSTGIFLNSGDFFSATADINDLWSAGALPRWSNADGLTGDLFATGSDDSGQSAGTLIGKDFGLHTQGGLSLAYGTLVGSIDSNFFDIGTSFSGNAIATGELKLWYWDSNKVDNAESVLLTVTTVPEPSIFALMGLGLVAIGFARRRRQS